MKTLLRSPLHRIASRGVALLHFRGRKSGREFVTPLSYVRDGETVTFLSAHGTGWWKNFRDGDVAVSVEIARETHTGNAQLWESDSDQLRDRVRDFLCALPRDAKVYGIKLDDNKQPIEASIAEKAHELVIVQVELD
jgi:deazaflavin-dependent oxidoreductase (nitroreductase family)